MFTIRNRTSMKPGKPRYDCLIEEATRECESFLVYNPSRRPTTFIDVYRHGNEYRAACRYSSDQGTSTFHLIFSRPV